MKKINHFDYKFDVFLELEIPMHCNLQEKIVTMNDKIATIYISTKYFESVPVTIYMA